MIVFFLAKKRILIPKIRDAQMTLFPMLGPRPAPPEDGQMLLVQEEVSLSLQSLSAPRLAPHNTVMMLKSWSDNVHLQLEVMKEVVYRLELAWDRWALAGFEESLRQHRSLSGCHRSNGPLRVRSPDYSGLVRGCP
jgi:hypothetical protein